MRVYFVFVRASDEERFNDTETAAPTDMVRYWLPRFPFFSSFFPFAQRSCIHNGTSSICIAFHLYIWTCDYDRQMCFFSCFLRFRYARGLTTGREKFVEREYEQKSCKFLMAVALTRFLSMLLLFSHRVHQPSDTTMKLRKCFFLSFKYHYRHNNGVLRRMRCDIIFPSKSLTF